MLSKSWLGNLTGSDHLEDIGRKIILEWNYMLGSCELNSSFSGYILSAGSCEQELYLWVP
jgi:hypothetical protein